LTFSVQMFFLMPFLGFINFALTDPRIQERTGEYAYDEAIAATAQDTVLAVKLYEEALRKSPNLYQAHTNLANILVSQGKIDKGIGHYKKALEIKPDDEITLNALASTLIKENRIDEAIKLTKDCFGQGYYDCHQTYAHALDKKGDYLSSYKAYTQLSERQHSNRTVFRSMLGVAGRAGRIDLAAQALELWGKNHPDDSEFKIFKELFEDAKGDQP
jgi:tetratricopeptide (TPR) repeat protein